MNIALQLVLLLLGIQFLVLAYMFKYRQLIVVLDTYFPERIRDLTGMANWLAGNLFALGLLTLATLGFEVFMFNNNHYAYLAYAIGILPVSGLVTLLGGQKY